MSVDRVISLSEKKQRYAESYESTQSSHPKSNCIDSEGSIHNTVLMALPIFPLLRGMNLGPSRHLGSGIDLPTRVWAIV